MKFKNPFKSRSGDNRRNNVLRKSKSASDLNIVFNPLNKENSFLNLRVRSEHSLAEYIVFYLYQSYLKNPTDLTWSDEKYIEMEQSIRKHGYDIDIPFVQFTLDKVFKEQSAHTVNIFNVLADIKKLQKPKYNQVKNLLEGIKKRIDNFKPMEIVYLHKISTSNDISKNTKGLTKSEFDRAKRALTDTMLDIIKENGLKFNNNALQNQFIDEFVLRLIDKHKFILICTFNKLTEQPKGIVIIKEIPDFKAIIVNMLTERAIVELAKISDDAELSTVQYKNILEIIFNNHDNCRKLYKVELHAITAVVEFINKKYLSAEVKESTLNIITKDRKTGLLEYIEEAQKELSKKLGLSNSEQFIKQCNNNRPAPFRTLSLPIIIMKVEKQINDEKRQENSLEPTTKLEQSFMNRSASCVQLSNLDQQHKG